MIYQSIRMERIKPNDNIFILSAINVYIVVLWCRPKKLIQNFNEAVVLTINNSSLWTTQHQFSIDCHRYNFHINHAAAIPP